MKIAITGATGQLGQWVIKALLKRTPAEQLVALVRHPDQAGSLKTQGIEVRHFDYDIPSSLAPALQGINKLLLISANEVGRRTPQHQAVIEAAQQAHVPYIAYTSVLRADSSSLGLAQEHRETEELIRSSGLTYTFLRNNWYTENYLSGLQHVIETGTLYGAANNGKISSASRKDYAEAAAVVLTTSGHDNNTYELAGTEAFTLNELAQIMSKVSGKSVTYQNLEPQQYHSALIQAGLPKALVDVIVDADQQTQIGAMFSDSKDLEKLIGHTTTSVEQEIKTQLQA